MSSKGKASNKHSWKDIAPMERLKLFQDLLYGLRTIHQRTCTADKTLTQNLL